MHQDPTRGDLMKQQLDSALLSPFTLIIKGTPQQAADEAKARGCKVHHVARLVTKRQTLAIVEADEQELRSWFTEDYSPDQLRDPCHTFPTGSLLLYTPKENLSRFAEMGVPR